MKLAVYLSLMLLLVCGGILKSLHATHKTYCNEGHNTDEEGYAALAAAPWESITHSHGPYGEHYHPTYYRSVELPAGCKWQEWGDNDHPEIEPEPEEVEIPIIEDYTPPAVLTCVAGCPEDEPRVRLIHTVDIHGNVPPERDPEAPTLFYPTIEIDGKNYWDPTREPYQISEEAKEAAKSETPPEGYKLEDIDGQLFLVPYGDPQDDTPVEVSAHQETFTIYRVVREIGVNGQVRRKYLEPTPLLDYFKPTSDDPVPTDEDPGPSNVDAPENPPSEDPQEQPGTQEGLEIQEEEGETFASLDGQFYQVTSTPATPLLVTEYMVATWGDGQGKLPQWIEIYNPNALAVNVAGYELAYVFKKQTHTVELGHFLIPPKGAMILATHIPRRRYRYEGIVDSQVYNLKIERNALTQGWLLKDALGTIISETGKSFGQLEAPIKPARVGLSRVSYNVYVSEPSKTPYFFGFRKDVSSPGFYEPKVPRSPALLRQRMTTTWASFKQSK